MLKRGFIFMLSPEGPPGPDDAVLNVMDIDLGEGRKVTVRVEFVKEIREDAELEEYVKWSGFKNVKEWRKNEGLFPHVYLHKISRCEK